MKKMLVFVGCLFLTNAIFAGDPPTSENQTSVQKIVNAVESGKPNACSLPNGEIGELRRTGRVVTTSTTTGTSSSSSSTNNRSSSTNAGVEVSLKPAMSASMGTSSSKGSSTTTGKNESTSTTTQDTYGCFPKK